MEQPKWDAFAVIEDLWWTDKTSSEGKDPLLNDNSPFFGSDYLFDTVDGRRVKNYYVAEAEKVARYAVPFVKNISRLIK